MNTIHQYKFFGITLAVCALVLLAFSFLPRADVANGSTLAFAVPKVATSSTVVVGPQATTTLFAKESNCVDRVISSRESAMMLSFNPAMKPSGIVGHVQTASTTVSYNNGDYGCTSVDAWAYSSTTITITDLTQ